MRQYSQGPDLVPSLPSAQSILAIVASVGVERPEQDSQRIKNIKMVNMVFLKRRREEVRSDYANPVAAIKSQKFMAPIKISELNISRLISLVMKLLPQTIGSILFFFPRISEDDDMKDSMIAHRCGYKLGGWSFLSKKKRILFDKGDDRVCDIAKPTRYQESIPIKTRFKEVLFYKTLILVLVWQYLD